MTTLIPKYDQGATGAVNRPFNLKLAEVISVKDFGAIGDGTTDDTTAFANAIAALSSVGGGQLHIPAGTYKYTSFLINSSNINVYGDGWGVTILQPNGWCDGIRFADGYPDPDAVLYNVGVENLTVDGVNQIAGGSDTYGNGVNLNGCDSFYCRKIQCINVKQQQIVSTYWVSGGIFPLQSGGYITDNEVDASLSNNICIGAEANCSKLVISGNIVKNAFNISHVGIYVGNAGSATAGGDINIVNNNLTATTSANGVGIKIENTYQRVLVSSNYIYGFGVGIRAVSNVTGGDPYNFNIVGNIINEWNLFGIILFPLKTSQNSQSLISANSLVTNTANATSNAIYVVDNAFVSGNRIYANGSLYGIYLGGSNSVATGNYVTGTTSYSIEAIASTGSVLLSNFTDKDVELNSDTTNFGGGGFATQRWTQNYFGTQKNNSNPNGNSAPVSGTWAVGDKVWNVTPASGGYIGFVCTVAGTPGTWKSFGLIS